jgi:hypothetical protein
VSNELRQHTELLKAVTCILGLADADAGLVSLASELSVALDPWSQPEFALCRQDYLFHHRQNLASGGAGFRTIAQLHNDSSDAIIVLEPGCRFNTSAGQAISLARSNTLTTTDSGLISLARDGRFPKANVPYVRVRSQNNAALPAGISNGEFFYAQGATIYELTFAIVMRPGATIAVYPDLDNVSLVANWIGRARRMISQREGNP